MVVAAAVTPSLISTPNATEPAAAERATIEAMQEQQDRAMAKGNGSDVWPRRRLSASMSPTIAAIKSQIAAPGRHTYADIGVARILRETPGLAGGGSGDCSQEVRLNPERDVWIALEDNPQWTG